MDDIKTDYPVVNVKGFATKHVLRLSETTIAKTAEAHSFLADVADAFLFVLRIIS